MVQADPRGVGSQRQVAELFGVSRSFVEQLFMRLRITGQATPKAHAGGKPKFRSSLAGFVGWRPWALWKINRLASLR